MGTILGLAVLMTWEGVKSRWLERVVDMVVFMTWPRSRHHDWEGADNHL